MEQFTKTYETMLGLLEAEAQVPGIENAFADGEICDQAYEAMRNAYLRLCHRLGTADEDPDLNIMVSSQEIIQRDLCRRMYLLRQL